MSTEYITGSQHVLNAILDVVVTKERMGIVGAIIGDSKEIIAFVARKLGSSTKSVEEGLARLVSQGYVKDVDGKVKVTHEGWQAYGSWDIRQTGKSRDEWLNWSGDNGYELPPIRWNEMCTEHTEGPPQSKCELAKIDFVDEVNAVVPFLPSTPLTLLSKEEFAAFAKPLDADTILRNIKHCHQESERHFGRGLEWGFACGLFLLWMKKNVLEHGEYQSWVEANCPFKKRQAERYTRLVRRWDEICAKATSEDAFETNSVAGLLEYVKDEAPPAEGDVSGEETDEAPADGEKEESPPAESDEPPAEEPASQEGADDESEEATPPPATIPFSGGTSSTSNKQPASKPKGVPKPKPVRKPKPDHHNWRLPTTAKFKKIERVGTEGLQVVWADGKKSYELMLSLEQAAPLLRPDQ